MDLSKVFWRILADFQCKEWRFILSIQALCVHWSSLKIRTTLCMGLCEYCINKVRHCILRTSFRNKQILSKKLPHSEHVSHVLLFLLKGRFYWLLSNRLTFGDISLFAFFLSVKCWRLMLPLWCYGTMILYSWWLISWAKHEAWKQKETTLDV